MGSRLLPAERNNNNNQPFRDQSQKMRSADRGFLHGWRKHCIFLILFFLMLLIAINLGFTLWILKALEVSQVIFLFIQKCSKFICWKNLMCSKVRHCVNEFKINVECRQRGYPYHRRNLKK
jgi:hypothetical protein